MKLIHQQQQSVIAQINPLATTISDQYFSCKLTGV